MALFTLVVRPDGQALLTTPQELSLHQLDAIRDAISAWDDHQYPVAILPDCEVVQIATIELDIADPRAH